MPRYTYICPNCKLKLVPGVASCPRCGMVMRNPAMAARLAGLPVPAPPAADATQLVQPGWSLAVVHGPEAGRSFPLGASTHVGRDASCEVRLEDPQVSRQHALIQRTADGYMIADQGSGNGTFVSGAPVVQPRALQVGDVIQLGGTQLQVQASGQAVAPTVPSVVAQPLPQAERGGCLTFGVLLYLAFWFVFWAVISAVAYKFASEPAAYAGIGLAALVSLILMVVSLSGRWQGQIVDIRAENVRVKDRDGHSSVHTQQMAIVRLPNGRTRQLRAMPDWQVGDWLEKRRGEGSVRVRRSGS